MVLLETPGVQMPHIRIPSSPYQQTPESSNSATRSLGAPKLVKQRMRKSVTGWCSCSNVQTCQLHMAQANFGKSLRRGFLSFLTAQSSEVEQVNPCEARCGHAAGSQVMPCTVGGPQLAPENDAHTLSDTNVFEDLSNMDACLQWLSLIPTVAQVLQAEDARQRADVELQASDIKAEQDKDNLLAKQLQACREEAAWLRSRVCQLQQGKHARDSAPARAQAAAVTYSQANERQPLRRCHHFSY